MSRKLNTDYKHYKYSIQAVIDNQLKGCFALCECDIPLLGMVFHLRYTGNSGDDIGSSFSNHAGLNLYSERKKICDLQIKTFKKISFN